MAAAGCIRRKEVVPNPPIPAPSGFAYRAGTPLPPTSPPPPPRPTPRRHWDCRRPHDLVRPHRPPPPPPPGHSLYVYRHADGHLAIAGAEVHRAADAGAHAAQPWQGDTAHALPANYSTNDRATGTPWTSPGSNTSRGRSTGRRCGSPGRLGGITCTRR